VSVCECVCVSEREKEKVEEMEEAPHLWLVGATRREDSIL